MPSRPAPGTSSRTLAGLALGALCCLAAATAPRADMIPPGHKDVRHELVLDWPIDRDWRFVASPTHGFHGAHAVQRGQPFAFSGKYGTRLYALPADAPLPAARERIADVAWPQTGIPVAEVRSVPSGHPLARVVTTLRVVDVDAGTIRLERVGEVRYDAAGRELGDLDWLPLAVLAAGGACWLYALARKARTAATPPHRDAVMIPALFSYLPLLALTLALELAIVAAATRGPERAMTLRVCAALNLLTHPLATLLAWRWHVDVVLLELAVLGIEWLGYRDLLHCSLLRALRLALSANIASWLAGIAAWIWLSR